MSRLHRPAAARLALLIAALLTAPHAWANLTLYPGPGSPSTAAGYHPYPDVPTFSDAGSVVDTFSLYSTPTKSLGPRVLRWDISGNVTELGHLGTNTTGYTDAVAYATNSAGTVVGCARKYDAFGDSLGLRPVRWDPGSTAATELHLPETASSFNARATDINAAGTVIGIAELHHPYKAPYGVYDDYGKRAFRWDPGSVTATELGRLGTNSSGWSYLTARAINDAGTIVGFAEKYDASANNLGTRAVRWDPSSTQAVELASLSTDSAGHAAAEAFVLNPAGVIAGVAYKFDAEGNNIGARPVRWTDNGATITELSMDNLSLPIDSFHRPSILDINSSGTILGEIGRYDPDGIFQGRRAVRWDPDTTTALELKAVPAPDGSPGDVSVAHAINDQGLVVGVSGDRVSFTGQPKMATLWTPTGRAINLDTLRAPDSPWIWLVYALSISNDGWVTGMGIHETPGGSYFQSFLLHVTYFDPCDLNLDSQVDTQDIDPFVTAMTDRSAYLAYLSDRMSTLAIDPGELDLILRFLDPSGDNLINVQDINPFIAALSAAGPLDAQTLALIPEPATLALLLLAVPFVARRHR
ncbi:MAG: hypothetical protein IT442_07355 [Phycisphaeraceae bacterium]|nr:hypothetical protein [Phycisphaeraceae bacterium]